MKYDVSGTGKDFQGQVELKFNSGEYEGITWTYDCMKMADHENPDGSMNMSFEYNITGDKKPEDKAKFENTLGDVLISILEEQIKNEEVIYKGTGEGEINETNILTDGNQ